PLGSCNPVWAQIAYWVGLARAAARRPGAIDKIRALIAAPREASSAAPRGYSPPLSRLRSGCVGAHLVLAGAAGAAGLLFGLGLPALDRGAISVLIALSLGVLGALVDGRRYAVPLEVARLGVLGALARLWA